MTTARTSGSQPRATASPTAPTGAARASAFARARRSAALMLTVLLAAASLTACADTHAVTRANFTNPCSGGYVAITFDDGPDPAVTPHILDELRKYGLRATFFAVGANAQKNTDIIQREIAEGDSVQTHTWDHTDLRKLPIDQVVSELTRGSDALVAAGAPHPTFFRPPYNHSSTAIREAADKAGFTEVGYTVDPRDWQNPGVAHIVAVVNKVRAGGIVQLHDRGHPGTIRAIPEIAAVLRAKHLCSGRLTRTAERNPLGPTFEPFYAEATAW